MNRRRLLVAIIMPSPFSTTVSFLLAMLILIIAGWTELQLQPLFATYVAGDYGLIHWLQTIDAESALVYNAVVICFALLVGAGLYGAIQSLRFMGRVAQSTLTDFSEADKKRKQLLQKSLGIRLGLRILIGAGWLAYSLLFINTLLPSVLSLTHYSMAIDSFSLLNNLTAFALLMVFLHVHVVSARLLALRPRFFGSPYGFVGRGGH